jgi:ubiquinone/menaquinone biosynthesis C-methylase UbiE
MKNEINLLKNYPKTNRDLKQRLEHKSKHDQEIAKKFGYDFFDGERRFGYGGYNYNEKFWKNVIPDFIEYYKLNNDSSILDVGSGKGFMLYDFLKYLPKSKLRGIDISQYAYDNCINEMKEHLDVGNAVNLPYEDNSFDLVISIVTLHNLKIDDLKKALNEIQRVSKKDSFITLDAFSNDIEKEAMEAWNLTAETVMHTKDWIDFFRDAGYTGDYYWFMPISKN